MRLFTAGDGAVATPRPNTTFSHGTSSDSSTSVMRWRTTMVMVRDEQREQQAPGVPSRRAARSPSHRGRSRPPGSASEEEAQEEQRAGDEDDLRSSREGLELRHRDPFGSVVESGPAAVRSYSAQGTREPGESGRGCRRSCLPGDPAALGAPRAVRRVGIGSLRSSTARPLVASAAVRCSLARAEARLLCTGGAGGAAAGGSSGGRGCGARRPRPLSSPRLLRRVHAARLLHA